MPTFDFRCATCGETFEGKITFGSKNYPACPACKGKKVEKLLTPPLGIAFKGSGFYKTDSAPKPAEEKKPVELPKKQDSAPPPSDGKKT